MIRGTRVSRGLQEQERESEREIVAVTLRARLYLRIRGERERVCKCESAAPAAATAGHRCCFCCCCCCRRCCCLRRRTCAPDLSVIIPCISLSFSRSLTHSRSHSLTPQRVACIVRAASARRSSSRLPASSFRCCPGSQAKRHTWQNSGGSSRPPAVCFFPPSFLIVYTCLLAGLCSPHSLFVREGLLCRCAFVAAATEAAAATGAGVQFRKQITLCKGT